VTGSGGKVFKDVLVPGEVKRGARATVGLTLLKRARVTFEVRKGAKKISRTRFPSGRGKVQLRLKVPSKPGLYRLIITVKPTTGKARKVTSTFRVR
jgi:hypothetical protein